MSPPQLARDTPVLDILQPVLVCSLVFCGIEVHLTVDNGWQGDVGKVLHLEEPLQRQTWFDGSIGVALRISHLIIIVLHALHQSCLLQILCNLTTAVKAVHTHI